MITNLEELYCDQLRDLYSAETQLIAALPDMMGAASNSDLREGFAKHLEETREHRVRLELICARRAISPEGEDCDAMRGLIKEAKKHVGETLTGEVRDAVLIASANRVEHYEIAAYGVTRAFAKALGYDDDAKLLGESLDEEAATDEALTKIATGGLFGSGVNAAAIH
jgi:ferritin-like metal-binding protein YciE